MRTAQIQPVSKPLPPCYPDISDILTRKAKGRAGVAKRSFGQKIAIVEALREAIASIQTAGEVCEQGRKPPKA